MPGKCSTPPTSQVVLQTWCLRQEHIPTTEVSQCGPALLTHQMSEQAVWQPASRNFIQVKHDLFNHATQQQTTYHLNATRDLVSRERAIKCSPDVLLDASRWYVQDLAMTSQPHWDSSSHYLFFAVVNVRRVADKGTHPPSVSSGLLVKRTSDLTRMTFAQLSSELAHEAYAL